MASHVELRAEPRVIVGKHVSGLRREGFVPGNVYGPGITPTPIQVDRKAFQALYTRLTPTTMIDLVITGENAPREVYLREIQWEPAKHLPVHLDFLVVRADRLVTGSVPLIQRGEAPAARRSDVAIQQPISQVRVSALPTAMPTSLGVDITALTEPDQAIHLRDVHLPAGVTLLDNPDEVIVKAQLLRGTAAEAAATPAEVGSAAPAREETASGEQSAT